MPSSEISPNVDAQAAKERAERHTGERIRRSDGEGRMTTREERFLARDVLALAAQLEAAETQRDEISAAARPFLSLWISPHAYHRLSAALAASRVER